MKASRRVALLAVLAGTASAFADLLDHVIAVDSSVVPPTCGGTIGRNWCNPYTDLQAALAFAGVHANNINQIWVAQAGGTSYVPGTVPADSFVIPEGVAVYGGFLGTETALAERDLTVHPWYPIKAENGYGEVWGGSDGFTDLRMTQLSGYLGSDTFVYHVVTMSSVGPSTILDGFNISAGHANGTGQDEDNGSGILMIASGAQVIGCSVQGSGTGGTAVGSGGGVYATEGSAIPQFIRCAVSGCTSQSSTGGGGGVWVGGSANFDHCRIGKNIADYLGGGIGQTTGALTVRFCGFEENRAPSGGGIGASTLDVSDSFFEHNVGGGAGVAVGVGLTAITASKIVRCRFDANQSGLGGGIWVQGFAAGTIIADSLFRSNTALNLASAIQLDAGATVSNCTLRENVCNNDIPEAPGAAIVVYGTPAFVNNSILWENVTNNHTPPDDEAAQAAVASTGSCVFNNSTIQDWGQGLLTGDSTCNGCRPAFVLCSLSDGNNDTK